MSQPIEIFKQNYTNYHQRCVNFANSFIYDNAAAEDIATDALLVLWTKLSSGEQIEEHIPYLFAIARNKCLHFLKHQQVALKHQNNLQAGIMEDVSLRISSLEACDPELLFSKEVMSIINNSLNQMGDNARKVFCLSRYNGMSNKEISEHLGIALKTVEFHMSKALKLLRHNLKDFLPIIAIFLQL